MDSKKVCKAFSNPERLKLLACLKQTKTVTELSSKCTLSQSALSQHLKILRDAHLVTVQKKGKHVFYTVRNKKILSLAQGLTSIH